jgi:hypothetical protein
MKQRIFRHSTARIGFCVVLPDGTWFTAFAGVVENVGYVGEVPAASLAMPVAQRDRVAFKSAWKKRPFRPRAGEHLW